MFSDRVPWPDRENRLTRARRRRRAEGGQVIDLTETNPTRVGLLYPEAAIAQAMAHPAIARYAPDPRGMLAAREAVAAWLRARGREVTAERLVLTASTSEAYALLFKILCAPGDSVLVPIPSYPLFEHLARLEGVTAVSYRLDAERGWRLDLAALTAAVDHARNPRAVVVVNPNNPTGTALRAEERDSLDRFCAARGLAILSDEVFFEHLFTPDMRTAAGSSLANPSARQDDPPISFATGAPEALTFILGGLSKSCGLPQVKLGWIATAGLAPLRDEALGRLEFAADAFLSVGTPVQLAAERLLALGDDIGGKIADRTRGNLGHLLHRIPEGSPVRLEPGDGGWSAVLRVPAVRGEEELVLLLLQEDGVLVHPGFFFDYPREAYLVVSLLPPPGEFRTGVDRLLDRATPSLAE